MPTASNIAGLRPTIATLWLGMVIGVSFIATPIKFQAPGLALPVALDIGRLTFGAFARVEWMAAGLLVVASFASHPSGWRRITTVAVVLGVAVQSVWLLPALNTRVETIISGQVLDPSFHHLLYAGMEVVKALCLLALAFPARPAGRELTSTSSDQEWQSSAM